MTRARNRPVYEADPGVVVYAPTLHPNDSPGEICSRCNRPHEAPAGYPSFRIVYHDPPHTRTAATRRTESRATLRDARARARELAGIFRVHGSLAGFDKTRRPFDEVLDLLGDASSRTDKKQWSEATAANKEIHIRVWLRPLLGNIACGRLDLQHANALVARMRLAGKATGTIIAVCQTFAQAVRLGEARGYIPSASRVLRDADGDSFLPRRDAAEQGVDERYVSPDEIPPLSQIERARLLMAERRGWLLGFLVWLIAHSGIRLGEALALRIDDVRFDDASGCTLRIERQSGGRPGPQHTRLPKYRKRRTTALLLDDMNELHRAIAIAEAEHDAGRNPDRLLFPSPRSDTGHYWTRIQIGHWWREVATELGWRFEERPLFDDDGLPKLDEFGRQRMRRELVWTVHGLRHYWASWALRPQEQGGLGLELPDVSHMLGHSTPDVTLKTYWNLRDGTFARAAAALRSAMRGPRLRSAA